VKYWLVISLCIFCALAANAGRIRRDATELPRATSVQAPMLKVKKAFFSPVKSHQPDQQSETFHRDNCNRSVTQCRNNGNDNIINGHTLPLALIICTRSQHASPLLPSYTSILSRLLLFPNHYFW